MSFHDEASSPAGVLHHDYHDSARDAMTQMAARKDGKAKATEKRKQTKSAKSKSSEPVYKSAEFVQESSDEERSQLANTKTSNTNQEHRHKDSESTSHDRRKTAKGATEKASKRESSGNNKSDSLNTKSRNKSIGLQQTHVKNSRPNGNVNGVRPSVRDLDKSESDTGSESESVAIGAHPGRESEDDEDEGDEEVEDMVASINGSEEDISDSEGDSEPGSEEGLLDLEAEEATEEEEEDEEEEEEEEEEHDEVNGIDTARKNTEDSLHKQKSGRRQNKVDVVPTGSEGDDAGDDDSEESSASTDAAVHNHTETGQPRVVTVTEKTREIPDYTPPDGFTLADIETSETQDLFSQENLEGKEIWYLTAPSFIPISSLEQLSLQSIADGSRVLSHDGCGFGIVSYKMGPEHSHRLLTSRVTENDFKGSTSPVSRALQMQQIFDVPIRSTAQEQTESPIVPQMPSLQNEQPPMVKMRSHGFGIPGCTLSESDLDSEGSDREPTAAVKDVPPVKSLPPLHKKKRKRSDVNPFTSVPETTPSSPKKSKTVTSSKTAMLPPTPETSNTPFYTPKEQPHSIDSHDRATDAPMSGSSAITPSRSKTKEERQRRREEDHQQKLRAPFRVPRSSSPAKKQSVISDRTDNERDHSKAANSNAELQPQPAMFQSESKASAAASPPKRDFISASEFDPQLNANADLPAKANDKASERRARKAEKRRRRKELEQQTGPKSQAVSSSSLALNPEDSAVNTGPSFSPQVRSIPRTQLQVNPDAKDTMDIDPPGVSSHQDRQNTSDEAKLRKAERKRRKEERRQQKETTAEGTIPSENKTRSPPNSVPPQKPQQKSHEKPAPRKDIPQPEIAREKHADPVFSNGITPINVASSDKKSNVAKPKSRKAAKQAAMEEERQKPQQLAVQSPTEVLPSLRGLFDPSKSIDGTPATLSRTNSFQTPLSVSGLNFKDIFNKGKQNGVMPTNGLAPQTSFEQQNGRMGTGLASDGTGGKEASEGKVKRKEKRKRKSE